MAHGNSPRHARKPKKAAAKKPARSAASREAQADDRPPRGRYSKTLAGKAAPSRKASEAAAGQPSAPPRGRASAKSGSAASKPARGRSAAKAPRVPKAADAGAQRLQKLLASAGFGSRRDVERFLVEERVTVNGRVASLGDKADPLVDEIRVDGERLAREKPAYWIVNKPRGVITTVRDDEGRRTVMSLLPPKVERLFPVGRLDLETSGLLLMTNDGDLAHALLHPSLGNEREYRVNVKGELDAKAIARLERGVSLDEGKTAKAQVEDVRYDADSHTTSLSLTLVEGKKRQIRRSLLVLGFPVRRLVRVRMGPLRIGRLPVGEARPLRPEERRTLLEHVRRLRAGEPVAAPARSGSGRKDLAAPPRGSGGRRPAKRPAKKASARRAPGNADAKARRSPPSGPRAMASATRKPPSGPRAEASSARRSPPRGPRGSAASDRRSPPSGPKSMTTRGRGTGPAGPRKKVARKKSSAERPGTGRAPKKGARKKAARKKAGAKRGPARGPAKGAARKRPGNKPGGRSGPRGRR